MFDGGKNEGGLDVPQAVTKHTNLHIEVCVLLPNTMLFHLEKTISEKSEERSWWNLELTNSYLFSQVVGNFVETLCGNCVFPQTVDTTK